MLGGVLGTLLAAEILLTAMSSRVLSLSPDSLYVGVLALAGVERPSEEGFIAVIVNKAGDVKRDD